MFKQVVRPPKESEMALSGQVKECVNEAARQLREALAFAARSEHPVLVGSLSDLIIRIESLDSLNEAMAYFGSSNTAPKPDFRMGYGDTKPPT
jgi:hypothetical protein